MDEEFDSQFGRIHDRIDKLNERLDTMIFQMNGRFDALNARLDTLIDTISDLRKDFLEHTHE